MGEFSFKTNIDESLLKTFQDLVNAGVGQIIQYQDASDITANADIGGFRQLTITSDWTAYIGEPVSWITATGKKSNINIIESVSGNNLILRFVPTARDLALLSEPVALFTRSYIQLGKTDPNASFQFLARYNDGSVKVFRGSGVAGTLKFSNTVGS